MNQKTTPDNDYNEVINATAKCVEAVRTGNIDMLADIFHEDCVTYGTVDGKLMGGAGGNPTADFIKNYGPSPEMISRIDVLDITPTTAIVRVANEKDAVDSKCNDYLSFIKIDNHWTVIAKVFHQFDK